MRNFEERKAEVFRRSEKRIKARKKRRKQVFMACIPLVLCATLLSVHVLPGMMQASSEKNGADAGVGSLKYMEESLLCVYSGIEITGDGVSHSINNASEVLEISSFLNACILQEPEYSVSDGKSSGMEEDSIIRYPETYLSAGTTGAMDNATADAVVYEITLTMWEGGEQVYRFVGKTLTDVTNHRTYSLTQEQLTQINALLGIQ